MKRRIMTTDMITDLTVTAIAFGAVTVFAVFGFMIALAMPRV